MPSERLPLDEQLQAAVLATGESLYKVAKAAGLSYAILHRFMAGKRSISLETADQLAQSLGLTFSPDGKLVKANAASKSTANAKQQMAGRLLDRAFGGSLHQLVASALAHRPPTREEIAGLQTLLDETKPKRKTRRPKP